MIQKERIRILNDKPLKDEKYVLYWMQASHRVEWNHALEYAVEKANKLKKPLVVYFGLMDEFPEANERHYYFMLEGIREVESSLKSRGIKMVILQKNPAKGAIELSKDACLLVVDRGYLGIQKEWYDGVAKSIECPFIQVETNVIVPVETASGKEEYSAATLRRKINKIIDHYLVPMKEEKIIIDSLGMGFDSFPLDDMGKAISNLKINRSVKKVENLHGGSSKAKKHLENFIKECLDGYPELRNDPSLDYSSNMSPYLHFGQISPLFICLEILKTGSPGVDTYLEELIIRRELSMNFVHYNKDYDSFKGIPQWAQISLKEHENDPREYLYTKKELEDGKTHDIYWNCAQKEMVLSGKMHGYMRMYWAKKILEWSRTPREAYDMAIYLNNKYELDGRDPNGFTGVAWCFGKHDRAWREREIFGKVRYMNYRGLDRKFDMAKYVDKVNGLGD